LCALKSVAPRVPGRLGYTEAMQNLVRISAALTLATALSACSPQAIQQQVNGSLQVQSTSIAAGALPDASGCKGPGVSPQISWNNPPAGTRSLALLMDDEDSVVGHLHRHYYAHWLVFDMPADRHDLMAGLPRQALPDGSQQGSNDSGESGYSGPCPNAGSTHHYAITVYALDTRLGLAAGTTGRQLLTAIDGHILARGQILATYTH
jgi:Raf kinase inhibitor-like YbhB/YbcL family protein